MKRRAFLKMAGIGTAAAVAGCHEHGELGSKKHHFVVISAWGFPGEEGRWPGDSICHEIEAISPEEAVEMTSGTPHHEIELEQYSEHCWNAHDKLDIRKLDVMVVQR
jgi:hypothetical protein